MNPIFNEYITFLRDTSGESLPDLKEGYFWLDRQILKGFDKQGNIHKFYRINISDSLKLSIDCPKSGYDKVEDIDLASWDELIEMNKSHLENIESELKILKKMFNRVFFKSLDNKFISLKEKLTLVLLYLSPKLYNKLILNREL